MKKPKQPKLSLKKPVFWSLKLYLAGQSPKSLAAFRNLRLICDRYLRGQYAIEVVDLLKNPQQARRDDILALPTLVRVLPTPVKKIIGDLSNTDRVLGCLEVPKNDDDGNGRRGWNVSN